MLEKIWENLSRLAGLLAIGCIFGLMVFSANIEIKDLDLWLHLKMGEFVVKNGYVPAYDVLSCTIAGKPWVNHEWLFQVVAYLFYNQAGAEGLIMMQVIVVVLTLMVLIFLGYNKEKQLGFIFILLFVSLVYQSRFTIRPDLFSLFFFVLYIYVLALHLDKRGSVYALFFIQVLWANCHGFFFWGPVLVMIAILSEFVKRHVKLPWDWNNAGRLSDEEFVRLKAIFVVVILATLINPLTFKGAWYPIGVLFNIAGKSRIFFQHIQELRPAIDWNNIFSYEYIFYKELIFFSFLGFFFNRRKIDIGDLLIWGIFLLFSLVAVRNVVYFAFTAYFVCISNLNSISVDDIMPFDFRDNKFQTITSFFIKVLVIFWVLQFGQELSQRAYFDFDTFEMKSEYGGVTRRSYPDKAADFLVENKVRGNFFNDFNSGAYLVGRCYPDIRVFIDGRTEVYGPEFFKDVYQKTWRDGDAAILQQVLDRYKITGALLNSVHVPIPDKTLKFFYGLKDWAVVYFDYDAVIFLKDVPENKEIIETYRIDLAKWDAKAMDLRRLGPRPILPYQNINRAYTLQALELDDPALAEAQAARKVWPSYLESYKIIGQIAGKREQYEQSFENFRIAATISPYDAEIRYNLALAYEKLGDWEGAARQYTQAIRFDSGNPKGYFLLAQVYVKDKKHKEALDILQKAHRLAPKSVRELLELGDRVYEAREFNYAKSAYEMAVDTGKDLEKVYNKIGLTYQAMGLNELAETQFQKSREVKKNQEIAANQTVDKK